MAIILNEVYCINMCNEAMDVLSAEHQVVPLSRVQESFLWPISLQNKDIKSPSL